MTRTRTLTILALALCLAGCPGETDDPAAVNGTPPGTTAGTDPAASPEDGAPPPAEPERRVDRDAGLAAFLAAREPVDEATVEAWLGELVNGGDDGFVPAETAGDELALYLAESESTTSFCLTDGADPHKAGDATWEARAAAKGAPDLLRCTWSADGLDLVMTQSVNLVVVRVEPKGEAKLDAKALQSLIAKVVRTKSADHEWVFKPRKGADLSTGTHLIASNSAPPLVFRMPNRDARADVLVVEGRVSFLFYKKIAQRLAFEDGSTWFRDSTRTALR